MMNRREAICKKIAAVKIWLVSAEQNFINDNSLRGELDLMLAEAEMYDIKKTSPVRKKIFFSLNILIIIGVFFSISFIYFAKDDIIFPKDKIMGSEIEEVTTLKTTDLLEIKTPDKETAEITTELVAETNTNEESLRAEPIQEKTSLTLPTKSDVLENKQKQPQKVAPVLTAEETREMVKLARENLRK